MNFKKALPLLLGFLVSCASSRAQLIVGIAETCGNNSASAGRSYVDAVSRGGHIPLIIPDTPGATQLLQQIDILMLIGGDDIDPARYGEDILPECGALEPRRDAFEFRLLDAAVREGKPVFGICRGVQVINVYFGGTLYQDIPSQYETDVRHRGGEIRKPSHGILLERDSQLREIMAVDSIGVNSSHHQAVKDLAPGFRVSARSTDGIIEGIESDEYPIAGVQFHPEQLARDDDEWFTRLFRDLLRLVGAM